MRRGACLLPALLLGCGSLDTEPLPSGASPDGGAPPPALDAGPTDGGAPADAGPCAVRAETGNCTAAFQRYTYDPDLGRCVEFLFGGCGDNPNNYESMAACQAACEPPASLCGGFAGATCSNAEVCDWPADSCGAADQQGTCRPRPQGCDENYDPVCGCDGQTYGNLCMAHAAGVDALQSGPCETSPAACTDQSRNPLLLGASREFGECVGECRFVLSFPASDATVPLACDLARLEVRGWNRGPPSRVNHGALTPAAHAALRTLARELAERELQDTYGCPGCDDGGIARLTLLSGSSTQSVAYELGGAPDVLRSADRLVQEILESLNDCTPSPFVLIRRDCVPR